MLPETTRIGQYTVSHYLAGRCHLFALCLHYVTGLPIIAWLDEEAWFEDLDQTQPALQHAFCQHPERASAGIDARGTLFLDDIEAEFASHANQPLCLTGETAKAMLNEWIQLGLLIDFDSGEQEALSQFIKANHEVLVTEPNVPDKTFFPGFF